MSGECKRRLTLVVLAVGTVTLASCGSGGTLRLQVGCLRGAKFVDAAVQAGDRGFPEAISSGHAVPVGEPRRSGTAGSNTPSSPPERTPPMFAPASLENPLRYLFGPAPGEPMCLALTPECMGLVPFLADRLGLGS